MDGGAMTAIDQDIAAYDAQSNTLEAEHMGKWVLFHDAKLINIFDSFETAAEAAVRAFGRGPYLIRQIGAPPITLPASVVYRPTNAIHKLRF
jgi:hypothetical protein